MNNWTCQNCKEPYQTGKHPYYTQGEVSFCADCYEALLKEKLTPKVALQRINRLNKLKMACSKKKGGKNG